RQLPTHSAGDHAGSAAGRGPLPEASQPGARACLARGRLMSDSLLLEVKDLKRHYRLGGGLFGKARTLKAVDGVSFSLAAGKTLAVVGESGCGKSTLA